MAKIEAKMVKVARRNVIHDRRNYEHMFQLMTKTFAYKKFANMIYESRFVVKTNCFHESIFTIVLEKLATAKVQMDPSAFCRKNSGTGQVKAKLTMFGCFSDNMSQNNLFGHPNGLFKFRIVHDQWPYHILDGESSHRHHFFLCM